MGIDYFLIINLLCFCVLAYMFYWAITRQYSDRRFMFRSLAVLSSAYAALLGYAYTAQPVGLILVTSAFVVFTFAIVMLSLALTKTTLSDCLSFFSPNEKKATDPPPETPIVLPLTINIRSTESN
jgi:hypothetical protein